jgi:hypothetical protein
MPHRSRQLLMIASTLWLSWLGMMLVHETGHVTGGITSGGTVRRVVWHPAVISRTDVQPNPHPLVEVWAGPLFGSILPVGVAFAFSMFRFRSTYLFWAFAGFCLIANGAYIGVGSFKPIGDAEELLADGMSRWPLAAFGFIAVAWGTWIWHRVSPRFGFGVSPTPINRRHVSGVVAAAVIVTIAGFLCGNRGN